MVKRKDMGIVSYKLNTDIVDERFKYLKGKEIEFLPGLNFVVSENGTGKSSLLRCLSGQISEANKIGKIKLSGSKKFYFLDTEEMNPRTQSTFRTPMDALGRFMSHGECILQLLEMSKRIMDEEPLTLFIDEPECGISPWRQKKLIKLFTDLAKKHQLIIATHSIVLTRAKVGQVIKLNKRKKVEYTTPPSSFNWGI